MRKLTPASRSEIKARPFAKRSCTSYGDLVRAIDERRQELHIPHIVLDDISGLQEGYNGKLFCMLRSFGPVSLELVLEALNLQLVIQSREAA